jgi:hypothetical protein
MSYQPLNIVIREAKLTDFLTDLATIFNTNDSKLKSEIEKIVNGLQLNTVTGVLGEESSTGLIPINQINTRTLYVVLPGTPATGYKLGFKNTYNGIVSAGVAYESNAYDPWSRTTDNTGYIYSMVQGTVSAGWRAQFDKITVSTVMQAMFGKFDSVQLSSVSGMLDCAAVAKFSGLVLHEGGHKESINVAETTMQLSGSPADTLYAEYVIGRTTPENIFVNLKVDANGYNTGWLPAITSIELRLKIDEGLTSNLPIPGQVFNFILMGIKDASGTPITTHPLVDVVMKANETTPGTPDFTIKNFGSNGSPSVSPSEIVFVPKFADVAVVDSLDTYGSSVSFIYNLEGSAHKMYVRNKFSKE